MPGGDRTGPMGMGSMTGRAAGYCSGAGVPGYMNPVPGRGLGRGLWGRGFRGPGRGRGARGGAWGRGWRWFEFGRYAAPYEYPAPYPGTDPKTESQLLKNQAKALQAELDLVNKRLAEVEAKTTEE